MNRRGALYCYIMCALRVGRYARKVRGWTGVQRDVGGSSGVRAEVRARYRGSVRTYRVVRYSIRIAILITVCPRYRPVLRCD